MLGWAGLGPDRRTGFRRQRSADILAYQYFKGGSGCGFSLTVGFTDFNPAPAFNFLLRPDAFAFFAFIRVSPLFAFRLLAWSPSSCLPHRVPAACHLNIWLRTVSRSTVLHYPYMQPARQFQARRPKTPCPCFFTTCRPIEHRVNCRLAPNSPRTSVNFSTPR